MVQCAGVLFFYTRIKSTFYITLHRYGLLGPDRHSCESHVMWCEYDFVSGALEYLFIWLLDMARFVVE